MHPGIQQTFDIKHKNRHTPQSACQINVETKRFLWDIWQEGSRLLGEKKEREKKKEANKTNKKNRACSIKECTEKGAVTWPTGCRYTAGIWDGGWGNRHWERPSDET